MARIRRSRWVASAVAVGALVAGVTAASTATSIAAAPGAKAVHARASGMQPVVGNPARWVRAGAVAPTAKPNFPEIFSCQHPSASFICYGPDQLRKAYGFDTLIDAGYNGHGSTIVIVDAYSDPTLKRDLKLFDQVFGLPNANLTILAPFGETPFDVNDPNQVGWSGEIALDVQYAHAMAPGAKIVLVEAPTNNDIDLQNTLAYVADHNLGDVVSQSFGEAESCYGVNADGSHQPGATLAASHNIYGQMIHEGITPFASAGDNGSAQPTCDGNGLMAAASTPASDPLVTGVGGTQLFANPRSGVYDHEIVWNEFQEFGDATGGGFSSVYPEPGFQTNNVGALPGRGIPDVAYNAAINHGVLVAWSVQNPLGTFFVFGGTSAGSPQWAALGAITVQLNHGRLGDINPALYQLPAATTRSTTSCPSTRRDRDGMRLRVSARRGRPTSRWVWPGRADGADRQPKVIVSSVTRPSRRRSSIVPAPPASHSKPTRTASSSVSRSSLIVMVSSGGCSA
jgi:subtilase family serine protease